jgi:hypothetical protein
MGRGRRRIWRKLHLGVDETTEEIVAVDLTTSVVHDSPHMAAVLDRVVDEVRRVSGDRAYASGRCYQSILERGAIATIPPRRNARLSTAKDPPAYRADRDAVVRRIQEEDRYPCRTSSGATRQSLAENAVSRFKALVVVRLAARGFENQAALRRSGPRSRPDHHARVVIVLGLPPTGRITLRSVWLGHDGVETASNGTEI